MAFEATRSILVSSFPPTQIHDEHGREPFRSPALDMVDKLNAKQPRDIISKEKMARLSMEVGLNQVVRWKPGKVGALCTFAAPLGGALLTCRHSPKTSRALVRQWS